MGTRKDLRERFRVRMGFPEDTTAGNARFDASLNSALRHLWSDLPDVLLSSEYRFVTEPLFEGGTLRAYNGTDAGAGAITDPLVMVRNETTGTIPSSEELRGRWLEIYDGTNYHYRRIQDHYKLTHTPSGGSAITDADHFVLDHQWKNTTDTALSFRIITKEYPYPEDVQKITHLIYDPDKTGTSTVIPMLRGDHNRWRKSVGWRATGTPSGWARGDFFQLPSPRYVPIATIYDENTSNLWGFNLSNGNEHGEDDGNAPVYEPAGTFSYKVVHVWGRRPNYDVTNEGNRNPWYVSAASAASEQIRTSWGQSGIRIETPNIDKIAGYNPDPRTPSYHRYGVEKWIFRARHTSEKYTKGQAYMGSSNADGVYYLWKIVDGDEVLVTDVGQENPSDQRITLESWHGHQSIRFDRLPTATVPVLMHVVRRPPQLHHDHDAPRVPEECVDCLFALCASYLAGDRDGSTDRKTLYLSEYEEHKRRLIRMMGIEDAILPDFGDGLGLSTQEHWYSFGQEVKEA